jgi:hypothetical protein
MMENKRMKYMEIIKLRSARKASEALEGLLSGLTRTDQAGLIETRLYRHATWETDLALHLHWESEKPQKDGSTLGIRLSQALKEFGPVDHSVWIEELGINRQGEEQ